MYVSNPNIPAKISLTHTTRSHSGTATIIKGVERSVNGWLKKTEENERWRLRSRPRVSVSADPEKSGDAEDRGRYRSNMAVPRRRMEWDKRYSSQEGREGIARGDVNV
jgi:hypothetical protein